VESTPLTFNTPTDSECILDNSDLDYLVSDQSTEIEEKSELKAFTHALQKAQITLLKTENKNRRGFYSKKSKDTLWHYKQAHIKLALKGFLPVDQYMTLRGISVKGDQLTLKLDIGIKAIILEKGDIIKSLQEESEKGSDEVMELDHNACAHSNDNSTIEKFQGSSPSALRLHLIHHMHMELKESSGDDACMDLEEMSGDSMYMDLEDTSGDNVHMELEESTVNNDGDSTGDYAKQYTVGSKSIAMFFSFRLFTVWCFMEWKLHLAL
jgi:hypothetical protein